MIYVGSTTETLSRRLAKHRDNCKVGKKISLYSHIVDNDWSNWYIELHEYYPCNNRTELEKREGEVIRGIGTINKCIAGRTKEEYREDNADKIKKYREDNADKIKKYREDNAEYFKKYREDNPEKIKEYTKKYREDNAEYFKKYREDNPEKIKKYTKKYREDNADKIKEKRKIYREDNANIIKEKAKIQICCNICGTFSTKSNLARHQKSKNCMSALN
jgi:hypothetical protein